LLLEDLGILGHILRGVKGIKVTDIRVGLQHWHERRWDLSKLGEWQTVEKRKRLDLVKRRDAVLGMGDETAGGTPWN